MNMGLERGLITMKLISARIEGFRNIENTEIMFGDITSLVSVNSYGKSNLMKAIDFAIDFMKADSEDKNTMMSWIHGIPFNKYIDSKNFVADFVFKMDRDGKSYYINYGFEFVWIKNNGSGKEIVKEWLYLKEDEKAQKYSKVICRGESSLYKTSVTGRCNNVLKIKKDELMLNKLLLNDSLYYADVIAGLNKINVYIERHLDASGWYSKNPLIHKNLDEFDLNEIENIPRAIFFLKKKYKEKYNILENAFFQLFPNIVGIDVKEIDLGETHAIKFFNDIPYTVSNKVYSMYIQDVNMNQPLDFESLSDGAKRMFLMLTYIVLADISGTTLIAFEEPENSIHPNLLQGYLNVLSQLSKDCKIIIASHSPYILQYVNTEDVYIGKPNSRGIAEFSRIDSHKINQLLKDASDSSESVGSYIFDLLSGGDDDIDILLDYLEK